MFFGVATIRHTAHNGCLQMEVTVHGKMAHAAIPESGVDAMQAAVSILSALYHQNTLYKQISSEVAGINHPYLNVGMIEGGTNTNVVPGRVTFKLDRRMIPEENPAEVEATLRKIITDTAAQHAGVTVDIKRMLLANAMRPLPGNKPLVDAIQKHGEQVFGEKIPALGTPLYTDVRLFCEAGIPGVIYGATHTTNMVCSRRSISTYSSNTACATITPKSGDTCCCIGIRNSGR